jgi:hypothetical protein
LQMFSSHQYVNCIQQLYPNEQIGFVEYHGIVVTLIVSCFANGSNEKCFLGLIAKCHLRQLLLGHLALALTKSK